MPDPSCENRTESEQVRSLLSAIHERYGVDLRDYARASITRRIQGTIRAEKLASIPQLERRLLVDSECMERFLIAATVNVTSMFRDPAFYRAFRAEVIPQLRPRPFLRIWHAGCSTGEEAFSLAILLREEGLAERCRIYATDVNADVLAKAKRGVFPLHALREYTRNYIAAGGSQAFSMYYTARYEHVLFNRTLAGNIVFSQHNLVADGPFNEFDVILCRNVMIYFNQSLANRVHDLLFASLLPASFLCLGASESVQFTPHESCYQTFQAEQRIYQKRA
ncbi:MAG: protein-glutamate O-methyltransferase CheR [Pirellulales bacterium]